MLRANPDQMAMLKQNNPKLSEALESGDLEAFAKVSIDSHELTPTLPRTCIKEVCTGVERAAGSQKGKGTNEN